MQARPTAAGTASASSRAPLRCSCARGRRPLALEPVDGEREGGKRDRHEQERHRPVDDAERHGVDGDRVRAGQPLEEQPVAVRDHGTQRVAQDERRGESRDLAQDRGLGAAQMAGRQAEVQGRGEQRAAREAQDDPDRPLPQDGDEQHGEHEPDEALAAFDQVVAADGESAAVDGEVDRDQAAERQERQGRPEHGSEPRFGRQERDRQRRSGHGEDDQHREAAVGGGQEAGQRAGLAARGVEAGGRDLQTVEGQGLDQKHHRLGHGVAAELVGRQDPGEDHDGRQRHQRRDEVRGGVAEDGAQEHDGGPQAGWGEARGAATPA
jgi:hypothetical protein